MHLRWIGRFSIHQETRSSKVDVAMYGPESFLMDSNESAPETAASAEEHDADDDSEQTDGAMPHSHSGGVFGPETPKTDAVHGTYHHQADSTDHQDSAMPIDAVRVIGLHSRVSLFLHPIAGHVRGT